MHFEYNKDHKTYMYVFIELYSVYVITYSSVIFRKKKRFSVNPPIPINISFIFLVSISAGINVELISRDRKTRPPHVYAIARR